MLANFPLLHLFFPGRSCESKKAIYINESPLVRAVIEIV